MTPRNLTRPCTQQELSIQQDKCLVMAESRFSVSILYKPVTSSNYDKYEMYDNVLLCLSIKTTGKSRGMVGWHFIERCPLN